MKRSEPARRTALVRRTPLRARSAFRSLGLSCGSLRVHPAHAWVGQSTGLEYRCPGMRPRKPLARSRMVATRPGPAVPPSVRTALAERSGGWCEMRLAGCSGRASDPCHRITRGNGGRHGVAKVHHDRLSNVVHGCRSCHSWCHDNVEAAEALGLMLREGDVPEREPVRLPGHAAGRVLLDNAGGFQEVTRCA